MIAESAASIEKAAKAKAAHCANQVICRKRFRLLIGSSVPSLTGSDDGSSLLQRFVAPVRTQTNIHLGLKDGGRANYRKTSVSFTGTDASGAGMGRRAQSTLDGFARSASNLCN